MKRFVWRLQRVLEIKTKEEQKKRSELLQITENLAQTRGQLLTWQKRLEDIIESLTGESPKKRLGKQEFFLKYSWISDEQIKILKKKVTELERRQREKMAEVLKVKRFKEGLERLRAEATLRFIKEQEKLDQKELDESATVSFVREMIFGERQGRSP